MKSILIICNALGTGGAEVQTVALANGLSRVGHSISLISLSASQELMSELDPGVLKHTLIFDRRKGFEMEVIRNVRSFLIERKIQLILAVNEFPFLYALLSRAHNFDIPIVVGYHSTKLLSQEVAKFYLIFWWLFKLAKRVVYVSAAQRDYWSKRLLHLSGRDCVIYNGVNPEKFKLSTHEARMETRLRLGIPDPSLCLVSIAMMRPEKQHFEMIGAMRDLIARNVDCHLVLVGDGPLMQKIEFLAIEYGVRDRVHMIGRVSNVRPYLAGADCSIILSSSEAFSLAILESLSVGCPVYAFDVGGVREQISDSRCGVIVPANDRRQFR